MNRVGALTRGRLDHSSHFQSVSGFGAQAFSVSMNGVIRFRRAVLTGGGVVYSVETTFSLATDEALVRAVENQS